jgi:hypothetical protein
MKRFCDRQGDPWIRNEGNEKTVIALYKMGLGAAKIANLTGEKVSRVESFLRLKGVSQKGPRNKTYTQEMAKDFINQGGVIQSDRCAGSLV